MNRTLALFLTLASLLAGPALARDGDIDKVNGSIRIESGQRVGDLSTVNGSIHIAAGASAEKVSTVNGGIDIGERATIAAVDTVNGSVTIGAGAKVAKTISAVNGSVRLEKGADVAGHLSNVNGRFVLNAARVGGGIETVEGDIEIGADSRVEGGIVVNKPSHGWLWGETRKTRNPRIVIGPRAVVQGTLEFRRDVDLYVSDSATIGPVTGATVQKFSGEKP
jgi:DUF4097 and DUF4098 domain-containing protein YvlB